MGTLPPRAMERLVNNLPLWVFHSADDVIFQVQNSDRLVQQLRADMSSSSSQGATGMIQYNRYFHCSDYCRNTMHREICAAAEN
jgi:predicted peptidase